MRKITYPGNHIKLTVLAEEIQFKNNLHRIFEELWYSYSLLTEADEEETSDELAPEEEKAFDQIVKTFADAIKKEKSTVQATASDENKIEKLEKEFPDVAKLEDKVEEGRINEAAVTLIAGIIAAIPSLIKIFGYAVKGIGSLLGKVGFKKAEDKTKAFVEKIMSAGDALHHKYIKVIAGALRITVPGFGEISEKNQEKIAEIIYIGIVVTLGLQAGISAFESFKTASWIHGGVEGVLTAVKSGEFGVWLSDAIAATLESGAVAV